MKAADLRNLFKMNVKQLAKRRKLTVTMIAERVGWTATFWRIWRGTAGLNFGRLADLCDALSCHPQSLFAERRATMAENDAILGDGPVDAPVSFAAVRSDSGMPSTVRSDSENED